MERNFVVQSSCLQVNLKEILLNMRLDTIRMDAFLMV